MNKIEYILENLKTMYPDAKCELNYRNAYELIVAVALSAQTTDNAVNKVTPKLFEAFPTPYDLKEAPVEEISKYIKTIGLYRTKAKNIQGLASELVKHYQGEVPNDRELLMQLPGVGRKTANVVLSVYYHMPAIAVDTHVERVSKRLRLAYQNDNVLQVEMKLMRKIPKSDLSYAHHLFIFFGRYRCKSRNPECEGCPFTSFCRYYLHHYKEKGIS